jgi:two-component system, LytTR family, response regulator
MRPANLNNRKNIPVAMLLKDLEKLLVKYRFYRIHNSRLTNLFFLNSHIRADGGEVVMQNRDTIGISKRKKEEFLKLISSGNPIAPVPNYMISYRPIYLIAPGNRF